MKAKDDLRDYFDEYAVLRGSREGIVRIENALMRSGIQNMEQLCELNYEKLLKLRNVGTKGATLISDIIWQYLNDKR